MKTSYLRERYLIAKLYMRHREALRPQPFESENDRWLELVVALLMKAGTVPEEQARATTNILSALDLLRVSDCASLTPEDEHVALIEEILRDNGFADKDASTGRQVIIEVAKAVQQQWDGKLQQYLRAWGERLLDELPATFHIKALSEEAVRYAFTYWLQSVLGLPILLPHPVVRDYAQAHRTTLDDLVVAADSLNLNVALLDELVALETASQSEEQ